MKRIAAAIALALVLAGGAIGVTASPPGVQSHWVNFGSGYANSHGTFGSDRVHIQSVSPYAPDDVRAVVDDNGDNNAVAISWRGQCWSGNNLEDIDNVTGSTTINPPTGGYVINFNVAPDHIRCELEVDARIPLDGEEHHIDVSLQSQNIIH